MELLIGESYLLVQAINALSDLEVNTSIMFLLGEVLFIDELLRDVRWLGFDIFRMIKQGTKVKICYVKAGNFFSPA